MNPFQQAVIEETERDIDRQGQVALNRASDQAIKAGAFGGSRQGIQAAEVERNIMDAKRKATTDLRMKNYAQAQKAARPLDSVCFQTIGPAVIGTTRRVPCS